MIQNHVTSLELSQKLKELGVPQRSSFWWIVTAEEPLLVFKTDVGSYLENGGAVNHSYLEPRSICSAFLSSELGEMLPEVINGCVIDTRRCNGSWYIRYEGAITRNIKIPMGAKNSIGDKNEKEADCRAKMLQYLIENKLIQVESL